LTDNNFPRPEDDELLYLNGLAADTGEPLLDPVSYKSLTDRILEVYSPEQRQDDIKSVDGLRSTFRFFDDYELDDPKQAGWGLLVHADEEAEMKERLGKLIEHRNGRILTYNGEPARLWKEKNKADAVNPDKFPYYVLIAGSPTKIPFELQFSLDVLQSVGRIDFDKAGDYESYAESVVRSETEPESNLNSEVLFFAAEHDYATFKSSQELVFPLLEKLPETKSLPPDIKLPSLIGDEATKQGLMTALEGDDSGKTPAILFSATHGVGLANTDPDQAKLQGSIVCQDYKFPLTPDNRTGFISGFDVEDGFRLPGGVYFCFACFGAGSRARSDFVKYLPAKKNRDRMRNMQSVDDLVSYLPKALLTYPGQEALAIVGHVDPAWAYSFESPVTRERRIFPFGKALARMLSGKPIGFALNVFNQKYTDYSTDLLSLTEDRNVDIDERGLIDLADLWICRNDAQNYIVVGDPAARLRINGSSESATKERVIRSFDF